MFPLYMCMHLLLALEHPFCNMVYHIPVPLGYALFNIVQLEMVNIVVAVKIWDICGKIRRSKFTVIMGRWLALLPLARSGAVPWLLVLETFGYLVPCITFTY